MTMHKLSGWFTLAVPLLYGALFISQPAQAQYYNPTQQTPSIAQSVASGLLTSGQAANLANQQNSLAQRAARLLRNDGGVLTANDASKLARAQQKENYIYNSDVASNMNRGAGGGGLFSSLFGGARTNTYLPSSGLIPASGVMPVSGLMPASTLVPVTNYGYASPYVGSTVPYPVSTGLVTSPYTVPVTNQTLTPWQQKQERRAYYRQLHGL